MTPTKTEVEIALYYWLLRKNVPVIAPNVYILQGEQDMLAISKAGYASEFEIKMTRADYKADFKKTTYVSGVQLKHDVLSGKIQPEEPWQAPKYFWFVVPEGVVNEADIPPYAGLMYVHRSKFGTGVYITTVRKAPARKGVKPVPTKVYARISSSLSYRFFDLWTKRKNENPA